MTMDKQFEQKLDDLYQQLNKWFAKVSGLAQLKAEKVVLQVRCAELEEEGIEKQETIAVQLERIREHLEKINSLERDNEGLHGNLLGVSEELFDSEYQVSELEDILDSLDEPITKRPGWLNNKTAYTPYIQIPKVNEGYEMEDPTGIYTEGDWLYREVDGASVRKLELYEKLRSIWEYVILNFKYKSDVGDNWQPHTITLMRGMSDCEDTSVVFMDACRMVGVPADIIFNAVGPTSFGYHSYPIVYLTEGDIEDTPIENNGEGWYIFESTLRSLPSKPRKLKGSPYWVDSTANWKYQGKIYSNQKAQFNGIPGGKMTGASKKKEKRIENNEKKIEDINNDWTEWEQEE